ncbi:hypothetical protein [Thioalkalivibrio sp. ALJ7]|uniref:hypothetical protein n=1 Tax=Thioalkalivibrio sp. ALJ7 TaxID=1158756 RepID=UPI0012DC818A|nr:hypothetical protein [Thioalkalivibrio sp. ALJ7]
MSEKKLVLHIGYPKTGTTTIQKKWLSRFDNQINPFSQEPEKRELKKRVAGMFRKHAPEDWRTKWGEETARMLWATVDRYEIPFVYSHEGLSIPFFYRPVKQPMFLGVESRQFPVAAHLARLIEHKPSHISVDVVVTVRNQVEWLASLYAQQSHLMKAPSQEDFEARTRNILREPATRGSGFIEYNALYQALSGVIGKSHVHMLFLEEIGTNTFWSYLGKVSELPVDYSSLIDPEKNRENVRSVADSRWALRRDERLKKTQFYKKASRYQLGKRVLNSVQSRLFSRDRGVIEMTADLESAIRSRFHESNRRLAQLLKRELPQKF